MRRAHHRRRLLTAADLAATCLFAVEGAILARYANLDVFGILVVGFVSALYPITAFAGAGLVVALSRLVEQIPGALLQLTDAAGLALFAVGGGVTRDVALNVVPGILRQDIYAVTALAGAGASGLALHLKLPRTAAMGIGFVVCFGLRLVSVWRAGACRARDRFDRRDRNSHCYSRLPPEIGDARWTSESDCPMSSWRLTGPASSSGPAAPMPPDSAHWAPSIASFTRATSRWSPWPPLRRSPNGSGCSPTS